MNPAEIIARKRDKKILTSEEINYFVLGYTKGDIPDYQMSALLMAILLNSMTAEETAALTNAMLESGDQVVFDPHKPIYVDKHSSGGIGDKISIILAPLMAVCGLKVPMLSGRGLGHTGGTLDKLESISGFRTDLSIEEYKAGVESVGCIITGQTAEIAPADRMIYALRDVTATVESIPLICGSILSKKFAAGPNSIVFDIKCGNGAFMKNMEQAEDLGRNLRHICQAMAKGSAYLITDMNQPSGRAAGNALEIDECVLALNGQGPDDLMQIVFSLGECMLNLGGISAGNEAIMQQMAKIEDGSAFEKFLEMIAYQGGQTKAIESGKPIAPAKKIISVHSDVSGYIESIDTYRLGRLIIEMDGGRTVVGQQIDLTTGFVIHEKIGDQVDRGELIFEIHSSGKLEDSYLIKAFRECIRITNEEVSSPELIKSKSI
ncbi:MAG: thymidine phosphorylase [candidate division Zixibacteria bacterium]|nr:thymidine phosphorylase [candidate division Zixibacteria bacterium]